MNFNTISPLDGRYAQEAEEYANKNVPIDTFGFRSLDDVHYDVKQAFLAGLKAGKDMAETEKELNNMLVSKNQQLTKAKEIIKEMLNILPKENIEGIYEIAEEAEQFLRENT